jgi:transposase InsO family protein
MSKKNALSREISILTRALGDREVRKRAARLTHEAILLVRSLRDAYVRAERAERQGEPNAAPAAAASAVKVTLAARSALRKS